MFLLGLSTVLLVATLAKTDRCPGLPPPLLSALNGSALEVNDSDGRQLPLAARAQLVKYDGCTAVQDAIIDEAREQFRPLAMGTKRWYDAMTDPAVPANVRQDSLAVYQYWFGDMQRVPQLYRDYNRVIIDQVYKNAINGKNDCVGASDPTTSPLGFRCGVIGKGERDCIDNSVYGQTASDDGLVNLCPLFFSDTGLAFRRLKDSRKNHIAGGVIAHEVTHSKRLIGMGTGPLNNRPSTDDRKVGYGWNTCHDAASSTNVARQQEAILNADNYEYYFQRSYFQ
ncbi:hypothetical protein PM082_009387 [Marasmius tenuissimus]|nr:hypothetical protein PM082_009387 [Marasmius tenuissimus]